VARATNHWSHAKYQKVSSTEWTGTAEQGGIGITMRCGMALIVQFHVTEAILLVYTKAPLFSAGMFAFFFFFSARPY